jgi:hypothetical protein
MARITKGILGGGRGKVANVVMGSWKGIDYIRAYAVPSNPRSPAQVVRRNILTFSSKRASELNKFFSRIPDELPKLSNYNILVRRLINGANFYQACVGFGTRNDIPTTANLTNLSSVVISGSFVAGDKIVLGFFGVDAGPELVQGSGKVFQVTVSASTATSVTINASSFPAGDYDDFMAVWTTIRGGQANIVEFNQSFE